jgi:ubiquitin carboxyl-terminal hydrolase 14
LATPELQEKLLPASRKLKDIERERAERRKVRKKTKVTQPSTSSEGAATSAVAATAGAGTSTEAGGDVEMADAPKEDQGGELQDESVYRAKEAEELNAVIHADLKSDIGSSPTGLYELVGEYISSSHCRYRVLKAELISFQLLSLIKVQRPMLDTTSDSPRRTCSTP